MKASRDLREEIISTAHALHARGWVANHDGNITIRRAKNRFLATPTAVSKGAVDHANLIEVDAHGKRVSGTAKPFSELSLHFPVYERREDVNAVVHAHPPYATALACTGSDLIERPFMPEVVVSLGDWIPTVPFTPPGLEARRALAEYVDHVDAALLAGHGVISWGRDLETAYLRMELVEHHAKIATLAQAHGGVVPLPESILAPLLAARAKAGLGKAAEKAGDRTGRPTAAATGVAMPTRTGDLKTIVRDEILRLARDLLLPRGRRGRDPGRRRAGRDGPGRPGDLSDRDGLHLESPQGRAQALQLRVAQLSFAEQTTLGRTGLRVGRLGIASSYGPPVEAFEEAFERGCNYFTWGSAFKPRNSAMKQCLRGIIQRGKRDDLVLAVWSYSHSAMLAEPLLRRGLRALGTDYADVLLLGWYRKRPPQRLIDRAVEMKEAGLIRHIGVSSHNRKLFPKLAEEGIFDLFHVRYNAAHRGAESEIFPHLPAEDRPGIVSFTATSWGKLLKPSKMPSGVSAPRSSDLYRFALSHPAVDVCMTGPKTLEQMREALETIERGPLDKDEEARVRRIGDHVYGRK